MPKATILFADNDRDFVETRAEFLQDEGYQVIIANDPQQARKKLILGGIDLAVIDIRLQDDDDEKDQSGLDLVKEFRDSLPKIILTGFPSYYYVREVLKHETDKGPAASDFIAKSEGPLALLGSIENALRAPTKSAGTMPSIDDIQKKLSPVRLDVALELRKDYEEIRREARAYHIARLSLAIAGALVILTGGISALFGNVLVGVLGAVSGIITEMLAIIFNQMAKNAEKRMDRYHTELFRLLQIEHIGTGIKRKRKVER